MTVRRAPGRALAASILVLLVILVGCRTDDDPHAELERAVRATAAEPFTFALSAQADRAALEQLGDDAVAAAAFLEGAGVTGARDPDGRLELAVTLGGGVPLLEAISDGGDGLLLRTGLGELLGLEGRDPAEALGPALDELGAAPAGRDALTTSFAGGWVELTDVADLGELLGRTAEGEPDAAPDDLGALLDDVTVTAARDAGEVRRLDVEVRADALLAPFGLGAASQALPGTVDLRDGRILEVRVELAGDDLAAPGTDRGAPGTDGAASAGDGVVELVLQLASGEGDGPLVGSPEPGASLTAQELFDLLERLEPAVGGAGG